MQEFRSCRSYRIRNRNRAPDPEYLTRMDKSERHLLSDINSQMRESKHELKEWQCYRCPDCAGRTPSAERQTNPPR
ncbi:MAG: hypothetical protein QOI53_1381 [Verrucomicrobiota bacterium]|nr:hypothetical protein [Verrucomicrobiota bacterium]